MPRISQISKPSISAAAHRHGREPVVGIIGGGQLARMLCLAAATLGVRTRTVERQARCPAAAVSGQHQVGDWNLPAVALRLAEGCDVVTLENEFVDFQTLEALENQSVQVLPGSACLKIVQDKLVQKESLGALGIPTPRLRAVDSFSALRAAAAEFGFPFLLKRRRNGYDGKGNWTMFKVEELEPAWRRIQGDSFFAEEFCDFAAEVAVIICRSTSGETVRYPVVETIQEDHICRAVKAPAFLSEARRREALRIAVESVEAVGGVGSFGVEMFLTKEDRILVNELAPRVHNSGHYTIEACCASQFENHLRAILGWPLGRTELVKPAAVMVNLLGDANGDSFPSGVPKALGIKGARLHLYGKDASKAGRKMGHLTVLGDSVESAFAKASQAAAALKFGDR